MNYSKDGITVAPMLDTTHPKKSGRCPVKIRVTYNRVRYYYPTGKDLTPEEWETRSGSQGHRKQLPNSAGGR